MTKRRTGRPLAWREVAGHAVAHGAAVLLSAVLMLATAAAMGPEQFGRWSGLLAVASLCLPLASQRLETRLALAVSETQARPLVAAALAACAVFTLGAFSVVVPLLATCTSWPLEAVALVAVSAALTAAVEAFITACAHRGDVAGLRAVRMLRFILPAAGACFVSWVTSDWLAVMAGWTAGLWLSLAAAWWVYGAVAPSWTALREVWRGHRTGLRDSLWLGLLNAAWLNGVLPALNLLGLPVLAGQYAAAQRLLGAPLGVLGMALTARLMREGNDLHRTPRAFGRLAAVLAVVAAGLALVLAAGLYAQTRWAVPTGWRMPPDLALAAAVFLGSSFAVGSISVVAIRLRDETFLALWQTVALAGSMLWLVLIPTASGFAALLWAGGAAYWVLLWRWLVVSAQQSKGEEDHA